jgi:hypothetical protein
MATKKSVDVENVGERCLGFTKNHRQCRLKKMEGHQTCEIHKNYFVHWVHSHPYISYMNDDYIRGDLKRVKKEYASGLYSIDEDNRKHYVMDIPVHFAFQCMDFYRFISRFDCIDPLWNRGLFRETIRNAVLKEFNMRAILPKVDGVHKKSVYESSFNDIMHTFNQLGFGLLYLINYSLQYMVAELTVVNTYNTDGVYDWYVQMLLDDNKTTMDNLLSWHRWKEFTYCDLTNVMNSYENGELGLNNDLGRHVFETIVKPSLLDAKKRWVCEAREKCSIYKEELMMKMWHPSRIEKTILNGIEIENM